MERYYLRGMIGQYWYNFTEVFALALLHRPTPDDLQYNKKIPYGNGKLQYLSTFSPKQYSANKKSLFLYIHGGGFLSGITEMRNAYIANWAQAGFFAATVSYTYAPQKVFPAQLQEIFDAVDFLYEHADEYGFDPQNIVLGGESAGGYFITYLASVLQDAAALDALGLQFRHRTDIRVRAIVSHCGCYDLERLTDTHKKQSDFPDVKMMVPVFLGKSFAGAREVLTGADRALYVPHITPQFPPVFFTWGDKDMLRFEAFDFSEDLRRCGVPFSMYKSDGIMGMHAWSIAMPLPKAKDCLARAFDFVLPYLEQYFIRNTDGQWKFITKATE